MNINLTLKLTYTVTVQLTANIHHVLTYTISDTPPSSLILDHEEDKSLKQRVDQTGNEMEMDEEAWSIYRRAD